MLGNSAFGHTPLSSPLESPDVMQMLLPMHDMRATNTNSMASIKLSSADSLPLAKQPSTIPNQVRPQNRVDLSNSCSTSITTNHHYCPNIGTATSSQHHTPRFNYNYSPKTILSSQMTATGASGKSLCSIPETENNSDLAERPSRRAPPLEFSLSSVGRSFFGASDAEDVGRSALHTPDTPSAIITPTSSSNRFSDKSFTDSLTHDFNRDLGDDEQEFEANKNNLKMMFDMKSKMRQESYCGSWDLLEIDLDFHEVNLDPSFGGDVQEYIFMGDDDPYGVLPPEPTKPDTLQL